jgi:hypothetical protein
MGNNSFSCSPNANVFKKAYGGICLTVVLELPQNSIKKNGGKDAVAILKNGISNLLNGKELKNLLMPRGK